MRTSKKKTIAKEAPPVRRPEKPVEVAPRETDNQAAKLAVEAAMASQESVNEMAKVLMDAAKDATAKSEDLRELKKAVEKLTEVMLMPTELDVIRDSSDVIDKVRIYKLQKKTH